MTKRESRDFQLNIPSLKNGTHEFQFEINDAFFSHFEHSLVEKGTGKCLLSLKKSETMMVLNFEFDLSIELTCDRSLDLFDFPIAKEEKLIIKFGEESQEVNEDLVVLSYDEQILDLAPHILEFISLSIPMKKLHPRFEGEESPDLIYQTEGEEEESGDEIDPRWAALKDLKEEKK